jgi:hypothetical protein
MSENILTTVKSKRGRKPKNKIPDLKIDNTMINSEEEPIIAHLPISLEDVVSVSHQDDNSDDNIFIKSESDLKNKKNHEKFHEKSVKFEEKIEKNMIDQINKKIIETEKIFMLGKSVNKINVYNIKFKPGNRCLWCKYSFSNPSVELPEDYYNETFLCSGNFCSWNCAKSFNIDLNDSSTWKRESLLNLMYFKTFGEYKEIIPAPSWLMLEDFGGILSIELFRNCFVLNNKDYLVLHPPMITRQLQIEESYRKQTTGNKSDNIFDNELVLKRSKPIDNNNFNLEKTMGLKKIVSKKN